MAESKEARNKALVLKAFDTFFNKRDYAVAERLRSSNYIQHSAHIAPGREGLFNLIKRLPPTLKYELGTIVADGDFVIVHGRVQFPYDQMQQALEQMGMPPKKAAVCIEMFTAINTGVLVAQEPRSPHNTTPTSFETFVQDVFAPAYHGKATTA
jgi:predicted SnoaL-like aldol condensation-catalyzing enzyme